MNKVSMQIVSILLMIFCHNVIYLETILRYIFYFYFHLFIFLIATIFLKFCLVFVHELTFFNILYFIGMENFQKFVIRKLTNLELKINNISQKVKVIHTNQKLILEKLSVSSTLDMEQREIDVFEDLPLKDENSLQLVEEKLKNDSSYRNQMVSRRSIYFNLKIILLYFFKKKGQQVRI